MDDVNMQELFSDLKELITTQSQELDQLKAEIEDLKNPQNVDDVVTPTDNVSDLNETLNNFKSEMEQLVQSFNRKNPTEGLSEDFEASQMNLLQRRF